MAKNWGHDAQVLVEVALALGIGLGVTGYILASFITALPANSAGANLSSEILQALITPVKTIVPVVFTIGFIVLVYIVVKKAGLIGHSGKEG
jgi:phage shock protein PspC (stress-responsive transcriptional regulator)